MPDNTPRPTLAKVALLAHVSTATVSNVLAGKGKVSAETAARVREAARRVGYRTDPGARALSRGRTLTVGVLVSASVDALISARQSFFWGQLFDGFVTRCSETDVITSIANEGQAQEVIDSGIDALVILGDLELSALECLTVPFGLPIVSRIGFGEVQVNVPHHDVAAIAAAVCAEFQSLGRQRIAWMPGPASALVGPWRRALSSAAAESNQEILDLPHDDTFESLSAVLGSTGGAVDAIFGLFRNPRALLDALDAAGRRVPADVAVIVQSEGILEAVTTPTLTSLSLCGSEYGEALADRALAAARGREATVTGTRGTQAAPATARFELVRRESTISY